MSPFDHAGFQRAVIHVVAVGTSERVKPVMSAAAPEAGSSSSRPSAAHTRFQLDSPSRFAVLAGASRATAVRASSSASPPVKRSRNPLGWTA